MEAELKTRRVTIKMTEKEFQALLVKMHAKLVRDVSKYIRQLVDNDK